MKHILIFSALISISSVLEAAPIKPVTTDRPAELATAPKQGVEIAYLDNLIVVTESTLETTKKLRAEVQDYLKMQERFVQNTTDKELCIKMVKAAQKILNEIEESHLTQAFDPEFLNELSVFAKIGSKRGVPQS